MSDVIRINKDIRELIDLFRDLEIKYHQYLEDYGVGLGDTERYEKMSDVELIYICLGFGYLHIEERYNKLINN